MMILKGNILFTKQQDKLTIIQGGYIGIRNNVVVFAEQNLPEAYKNESIKNYGDKLIIPGFCDLHAHAPQFENIGLGMNMKLLPWLENLTFPTEAKYSNVEYAKIMYAKVVKDLIKNGTTRAVLFASVHLPATQVLVDQMKKAGLCGFVGKVNMDRNSPDYLVENTEVSLAQTRTFVEQNINNACVKPILTPRFAPSCSKRMLQGLGQLATEFNLPIQSHINENLDEIKWVAELFPEAKNYADVYDRYGLLNDKTLMAHCIYMKPEETELFIKRGVYAVHCPHSNSNISSGKMPLKNHLNAGMKAGLGSDISGGHAVSMMRNMVLAMQITKLRYVEQPKEDFLHLAEAFYLATKGGGSFFGKVGSFEEGYAFDALVIDDSDLLLKEGASLEERLGRFIYSGDDRQIVVRYINGQLIEI